MLKLINDKVIFIFFSVLGIYPRTMHMANSIPLNYIPSV